MATPLSTAMQHAFEIMSPILLLTNRWQTVGEIRRQESEVNQIDIVLIPSVQKLDKMESVLSRAGRSLTQTYSGYEVKSWFDEIVNIHLANKLNYAFQTLFKTGPKPFLKALQSLAKSKGVTLTEDGLISGDTITHAEDEGAIFGLLGVTYIKPEQRAAITKIGQLK